MNPIKVLLADDQSLFRDGLKTVLGLEPGITVAGMAKNGQEAVELTGSLNPDVILMDIRMPEMNGVEAVKHIREKYGDKKIIMLTTFNDDEYIIQAVANGACGYLLKDIEVEKLIEAIKDAHAGKMVLPPVVYHKLAEGLARLKQSKQDEKSKLPFELSDREAEICRMMVQGFTNKQIASALFITEGTARNYISTIYSKIGMTDRTNAVLYLKELGL
ncbi:MAG: response regulator transcription factor [Clostridia bacterium]|nr:response regulator transcription factor [Clostridia bacterium]